MYSDLTSQSHPVTNPPDLAKAQKDLAFLDTTLRNSKATWKFVVTHYPLWSAGAHGPTDNVSVNIFQNNLYTLVVIYFPGTCKLAGTYPH